VSKLEAGCATKVRDGKIVDKWEFYRLPYSADTLDLTVREAAEQTQEQVRQAVKSQLVSDVPVGAFLSGGLDSSAVVAMARECQPDQRIQCFTIELEGKGMGHEGTVDDLTYA